MALAKEGWKGVKGFDWLLRWKGRNGSFGAVLEEQHLELYMILSLLEWKLFMRNGMRLCGAAWRGRVEERKVKCQDQMSRSKVM